MWRWLFRHMSMIFTCLSRVSWVTKRRLLWPDTRWVCPSASLPTPSPFPLWGAKGAVSRWRNGMGGWGMGGWGWGWSGWGRSPFNREKLQASQRLWLDWKAFCIWMRLSEGALQGGSEGGTHSPTCWAEEALWRRRGHTWLLQLDPFKETSGVTPVQGIIKIGLFLKKPRVTAVTDSLDLLTHGFTFTLPSCRTLWTHWKRSLASARKQAKTNKYFFLFSFFLFFFFWTGWKQCMAVDWRETCSSHMPEGRKLSAGQNLPSRLRGTWTVPLPQVPPTPSPVPHRIPHLPNLTPSSGSRLRCQIAALLLGAHLH